MDQGHQSECLECLQGADKPTETTDDNQGECDVYKDANHDDEVEDIPEAPHISVGCENKPIRDDLDQEFDDKDETESDICNVEPCNSRCTVLRVVMMSIEWRCDRSGDDAAKDSQKDRKLETGVSNIRGHRAKNPVSATWTNNRLAETTK